MPRSKRKSTKPKKTEAKPETKVKPNETPTQDPQEENEDISDKEEFDWKSATSIYDFTADDINGTSVCLDKYKDHVCIIVNVASRCGHTKSNYEQFVELYDKYSESKGLRILAFPCNQFGAQESGTAEKIKEFAEKRNVKFDLFAKVNVNGPKAHPLFNYLNMVLPDVKAKGKGDKIKWNFTKFIIDDNGKPVERFAPSVKPNTLVETLEKYW